MAQAAVKDNGMLNVGDKAPEFSLPVDGGETVSLADFAGEKHVVLYFYPKDNTPGCTTEAKDFRDHIDTFEKADTVVLGVSKDSVKKHDNFKAKHDLPFQLISDESSDLCEQFGVWVEKNMYGKKYMGVERTTYLIDETGKILHEWNKVKVPGHVEEVLAVAKEHFS